MLRGGVHNVIFFPHCPFFQPWWGWWRSLWQQYFSGWSTAYKSARSLIAKATGSLHLRAPRLNPPAAPHFPSRMKALCLLNLFSDCRSYCYDSLPRMPMWRVLETWTAGFSNLKKMAQLDVMIPCQECLYEGWGSDGGVWATAISHLKTAQLTEGLWSEKMQWEP